MLLQRETSQRVSSCCTHMVTSAMRSYCRPMALLKTLSLAMTTPTTLCQSPLCCSCKAAVKLGMRYAAATMMQVVQTSILHLE